MSVYLALWSAGILITMLLQMRVNGLSPLDWVSPREAVMFVAVALLWPLVVAVLAGAVLVDFTRFLITATTRPR